MNIKRIVVGVYAVNCYIVYTDEKKGFIVDPGGSGDDILKFLKDEKITPEFILLTHGHGDHIGAVEDVLEEYKIPIYIAEKEKELLADAELNLSSSIPPYKKVELKADKYFNDKDVLEFYGKKLEILETPGHTLGSVCIFMDDVLFSGDTLFKMSIGRTDLPTGSDTDIINSLKKLNTYEKNYRVLPGHGAESTLDFEKENNPFMKR